MEKKKLDFLFVCCSLRKKGYPTGGQGVGGVFGGWIAN